MRRERFPAGAALAFADLAEQARLPALDELRAREPVTWAPALGGWLVAEALGALLGRLPGLRLVDAPAATGFAFRRPERLIVAWEPR